MDLWRLSGAMPRQSRNNFDFWNYIQSKLDEVVQSLVQPSVKYVQGERLHNLSRLLAPVLDHPCYTFCVENSVYFRLFKLLSQPLSIMCSEPLIIFLDHFWTCSSIFLVGPTVLKHNSQMSLIVTRWGKWSRHWYKICRNEWEYLWILL